MGGSLPLSIPGKHLPHPRGLVPSSRGPAGAGGRPRGQGHQGRRPRERPGRSSPHRASDPSSSPHDDPLALHVHLVEGELVGERHGCSRLRPTRSSALLRRRPCSATATASAAGTQPVPPLLLNDWAAPPAECCYWSSCLPVSGLPAPAEAQSRPARSRSAPQRRWAGTGLDRAAGLPQIRHEFKNVFYCRIKNKSTRAAYKMFFFWKTQYSSSCR